MSQQLSIQEVNNAQPSQFENLFGNIVENYPKIAKKLVELRPFKSINEIVEKANDFLENLDLSEKEIILKLHPDLAGRLADENKLTIESQQEQKSAGLDQITHEQKHQLKELNEIYKEKFGFPFVICARKNKFGAILNGIQERSKNSKEDELQEGINQVKLITELRIRQIITE